MTTTATANEKERKGMAVEAGGADGSPGEERETKKLGVGCLVEVRLTEKGLRGSWHPAVVVKCKPGRRVVEYNELLSDVHEGRKLRESISVGKGVDGGRSTGRNTQSRTPSKDRIFLRPRPPKLSYPPRYSWKEGLWVDVFWQDAWWEGVLLEDITPGTVTVSVLCPDEGGVEAYAIKDLRIRQEWDEETGLWSLKGQKQLPRTSFKDSTSKRLKFSDQQPDSSVKEELDYTTNEQKLSVESCQKSADEAAGSSDDELLASTFKRSKRTQRPGRGAVKAAFQSPSTETKTGVLNKPQGSLGDATGGSQLDSQKQNCRKKASITWNTMQEDRPECSPSLFDSTGRNGILRTGDSGNVVGSPQVQEFEVSRMDTEASILNCTDSVGVRKRLQGKQETVDIKDSKASVSLSCMTQQDTLDIQTAYHVQVKEEQAEDGCVDMVVDENGPPHNNHGVSNIPDVMLGERTAKKANIASVLTNQLRQASMESKGLKAAGNGLVDDVVQNEKSEMNGRKRLSGSHLPGDLERRSKKSRVSLKDEAAPLLGVTWPNLSQETSKSKRSLSQHKFLPAQEKSGKKNGIRGGCRMEVLLSAPGDISEEGSIGVGSNHARRNILSWLIDAGALVKDQYLSYRHRGKKPLGYGRVTAEGVLCGCCNDILTLSSFEAHCGSKLHRPCQNIFVDGGKSLTDLQIEVFNKKEKIPAGLDPLHPPKGSGKRRRPLKGKEKEEDGSDDTCGVCGDGGMLICCDHCPSTFHLVCMELQEVPENDWYCPNCRCAICGGSQFNGDQTIFNELTVLFCDQCEREFHVKCLYERGFPKMDHCPQDSWFCGPSCTAIFDVLRRLVGVTNSLDDGFSWSLLRSQAEDLDPKSEADKELMAEHNIKLSMALSVMQECFRPMIDPRTNVDLVAHALYNRGSDVSRLNYRGFFTMILEKGDELVSVATIRVHGAVLAEMPLIGTRYQYRRQGMCRRLMSAIEQMLQMVNVESLVLPAVPELMETWIGAFGFQPLDSTQKRALTQLNLMAFPGTSLLRKPLPRCQTQPSIAGLLQFRGSKELGASPVNGGICQSSLDRHQFYNLHSSSTSEEMVSVPIAGAGLVTGQDGSNSARGDFLQSYLVKIPPKKQSVPMPASPANFLPPRLVSRRDPIQEQHGDGHGNRYQENGSMPKESEENMYSTKVVVGTTRSKRLIKTTRWVADSINKLTGRVSPAQADPCSPGRASVSRELIERGVSQATVPSIVKGRTSASPCAMSCNPGDLDSMEPRKLIIRIKLGKPKEKKEKKRKKEKRHKAKKNGAVLGLNGALWQMTTSTVQGLHCLDAKPRQSKDFQVSSSLIPYQDPPSPLLQPPVLTPTSHQIVDAVDLGVIAIVPTEDFRDLDDTLTGWDPKGGMERLEVPGADFVGFLPALDSKRHLLPMLKQRAHLLELLPATEPCSSAVRSLQ